MSLHTNFHAPRTSLSGRIQIGHKIGLFIYYCQPQARLKPKRNLCVDSSRPAKWKTTSKKMKNGRRPQKKKKKSFLDSSKRIMEGNLKINKNGRRPQQKMEVDLKKIIFSWFLSNLEANLSWGWLSSLRFFIYYYYL